MSDRLEQLAELHAHLKKAKTLEGTAPFMRNLGTYTGSRSGYDMTIGDYYIMLTPEESAAVHEIVKGAMLRIAKIARAKAEKIEAEVIEQLRAS